MNRSAIARLAPLAVLAAVSLPLSLPSVAGAADPPATWLSLAQAQPVEKPPTPPVAQPPAEQPAPGWKRPVPIYFGADYALVTDYIYRGINYSEFSREGREKLSHQLGAYVEVDTGLAGTVGGAVWFDWFAANQTLVPGTDSNLFENDYSLYWRYNFEKLYTTVEVGWAAYTYPPFTGDLFTTYEVYGKLTFNDGPLFGGKDPVLSPYVAYYHDYDVVKGAWLEVGVKHDFVLADLGCKDIPVLKDITVTPSLVLGVDHRYLSKNFGVAPATRLGNLMYGLDILYNVSQALAAPEWAGVLKVGPFLRFSQAFHDELIDDEFFGGLKVSYAW